MRGLRLPTVGHARKPVELPEMTALHRAVEAGAKDREHGGDYRPINRRE